MSAQRRPTRRRTTGSRSTSRRSRSGYSRRRRQGLPSTVGAALGTLLVTSVLNLSWPARIGVFALVIVVGVGYLMWRHRAEIAAGVEPPVDSSDPVAPQDRPTEGTQP